MFVELGCALLTNLLGTVFHSHFSMWTHAHKHAGLSKRQNLLTRPVSPKVGLSTKHFGAVRRRRKRRWRVESSNRGLFYLKVYLRETFAIKAQATDSKLTKVWVKKPKQKKDNWKLWEVTKGFKVRQRGVKVRQVLLDPVVVVILEFKTQYQ